MVPAIVMLTITLALGAALAVVVQVQHRAGGTQRSADSAQTLAEGIISATANVMATDQSSAVWPTTGACTAYTGTVGTAAGTGLAALITSQINTQFQPNYSGSTWRATVCPVAGSGTPTWTQDAENTWNDTFLTRTITSQPSGVGPSQISVWIRGEATIRGAQATLGATRAVVSKVKQSSTIFTPPANYAVGTGVFSTDVSTGLNTVLSANNSVVGALTSNLLGTQPLIKSQTSNVGVRCGLLNTLSASGVCLSGVFAGVSSLSNSTGLSVLDGIIGAGRTKTLPTWQMAPPDAIASWKAEAQGSGGVYKASASGAGDDKTHAGVSGAPECFTETTTANSVVYIKQVGNGEQYCTISGTRTAKIIIVERGAVRITGTVNAVVYALNMQECGGDDVCDVDPERKNAVQREVVRIEGTSGKVKGAVWADGAAGAVGIYPSTSLTSQSLIGSITDSSGVCGFNGIPSLVSGLTTTLNTILSNVTKILLGRNTRIPGANAGKGACQLLKEKLATYSVDDLTTLYKVGGTVSIQVSEHATCALLILCTSYSVDSQDIQNLVIPPVLGDSGVVNQLGSMLGTLNNTYTAVEYDNAIVNASSASITTGAGPVIGTYANVKRT